MCHQCTRSTLTVYWQRWRVSVLGGQRKCLLMSGLAVSPWQRHHFVNTCCWSWIPQMKWPAALIQQRCHVEKMASVRRCFCTGRWRRFVWFQQAERWWRGWKCQRNRGGREGKVSDFFYKGKRIRHSVGGWVLKDWLEKTGKPLSQPMLGRSGHWQNWM